MFTINAIDRGIHKMVGLTWLKKPFNNSTLTFFVFTKGVVEKCQVWHKCCSLILDFTSKNVQMCNFILVQVA